MKEKINIIIQYVHRNIMQKCMPFFKTKGISAKEILQKCFKKGKEVVPDLKKKTVAFVLKWWHLAVGFFFASIVLYYPVGALIVHHIDVDPSFPARTKEKYPVLPGMLSDLTGREISVNMFTPNKPFFYPASILDDMPAFQTGIITGIKNITDILSLVNAHSEKLTAAAEKLSYSPFVWHIENWKPAIASVKKYKKAQELLKEYQEGKEGEAFNRSKEAAHSIVSQIIQGMENCIEALDEQSRIGSEKVLDTRSDNVFYSVKGQVYVYFLTLKYMKLDFEDVFKNKKAAEELEKAETFLKKAVLMRPASVVNGALDSQIVPNHLIGAGFYLARSVSELKNLENILQAENE